MKLKIKLFLTALPYLAVARADIGIVPRPLSAAEGRGGAITERTVVASSETLRQEKIRFRNRAVTYRNPCFVPADREEAPRAVRDSPASQAGQIATREDLNPHLLTKTACRTLRRELSARTAPVLVFISYLWR